MRVVSSYIGHSNVNTRHYTFDGEGTSVSCDSATYVSQRAGSCCFLFNILILKPLVVFSLALDM